jgi:hypothetical protein
MKLHRHIAADIIGSWLLLPPCTLERMIELEASGWREGAGMLQLQLASSAAVSLGRVTTPASFGAAKSCGYGYMLFVQIFS